MNAQKDPASNPPDILETDLPPVGFGQRLRTYFLTGLVVAGPLAITAWLIWSFITWVDDLVRPLIPAMYRPETYLPWKIPGSGLVIAFFALTLLGFLTANLVGRTLLQLGENVLDRMPIVRPIYKTVKQVFTMLFSKSGNSFRKVGLVEFPAPGMWSLVFHLAAAERGDCQPAAGRRRPDLGVPAVHAEPDDRFLFLSAAQEHHRTRYSGRSGGDTARLGRHDPAGREWRSEEARLACGHGAHGANGARSPRSGNRQVSQSSHPARIRRTASSRSNR